MRTSVFILSISFHILSVSPDNVMLNVAYVIQLFQCDLCVLVGKCRVIDASVHQRQFNISAIISSSSSSAAARVKGDRRRDEVAEDDESMGRRHTITHYKDAICDVCGTRAWQRSYWCSYTPATAVQRQTQQELNTTTSHTNTHNLLYNTTTHIILENDR